MHNDSTTAADDKVESVLSEQDDDHFKKCVEQVWYAVQTTNSPHLLAVYNELEDLRKKLGGKE